MSFVFFLSVMKFKLNDEIANLNMQAQNILGINQYTGIYIYIARDTCT